METKKIYKSKTANVNTFAVLLSFGLTQAGIEVPAEVQIAILGVVNLILRRISNGAVSFT
jgi:hypothetical protein